ncbi:NACHT domain-containing protein [Pseudomonas koreensis]|uniref:NACHT domain-containing protein n=1 Tax=Pseudomonas koreensis TaxID=198620 RepID=UPI003815615C
MSKDFYLPRYLLAGRDVYNEEEVLEASKYIIVLAEPGGGKTEVLGSLARRLKILPKSATVFQYCVANENATPLVIDGFDEVAKIDNEGIYKILAKIEATHPSHVVISSRSSEWSVASTQAFRDFLGKPPLIVRLREFDKVEQRKIFNNYLDGESFDDFQEEVARFDLRALLANPQFLKLFADAYIQSGRRFESKLSIFSQAIERLAVEKNDRIARTPASLSVQKKIDYSSEVFAKILLSGVDGVTTSEPDADNAYPLLNSLLREDVRCGALLATRLFLPGEKADTHRPVHKIVAEYCAADFLVKRILCPSDSLTLSTCLSVIAPNHSVRKELRGLLGWMASLGNKNIQEKIIKLDPYGVLANGDPSLLENLSKKLLIKRLQGLEVDDPYFRGEDHLRKFSVAGFFTLEMVQDLKTLIVAPESGHLRGLVLELLAESSFASELIVELQKILLDRNDTREARLQCGKNLAVINSALFDENLHALFAEASVVSLEIASLQMRLKWDGAIDLKTVSTYLLACSKLYYTDEGVPTGIVRGRYFVKTFIEMLDVEVVEAAINGLVKLIECKCARHYFQCHCLVGLSKIVGMLLDRYFELSSEPYDSWTIWEWVRKLRFEGAPAMTIPKSVEVLQGCIALRSEILMHAFINVTDKGKIHELMSGLFAPTGKAHAGLIFGLRDRCAVAEIAFITDNPNLWAFFIPPHNTYAKKEQRGPNELRQRMRAHAQQKPALMREWASANKRAERNRIESRLPIERKLTRRSRRQRLLSDQKRLKKLEWVRQNRARIELGDDWDLLATFSDYIRNAPGQIEREFGDSQLVQNALVNCIPFLLKEIPTLHQIGSLHATNKVSLFESILYAACIVVFRAKGTLKGVDIRLLRIFRTGLGISYTGVAPELRHKIRNEVNEIVFSGEREIECFLREYLEVQIERSGAPQHVLWIMSGDDVFANARVNLSIEWLEKYPDSGLSLIDKLFQFAAQCTEKTRFEELVRKRCDWFSVKRRPSGNPEFCALREFWLMRGWWFIDHPADEWWRCLKEDEKLIFKLSEYNSRRAFREFESWPKLNISKLESILKEFAGKWPAVSLPDVRDSGSETPDNAYSFLKECVWSLDSVESDLVIPALDRLLMNPEMSSLKDDIKSIRASQIKRYALRHFQPPTAAEIVQVLDHDEIISVEGLRQLVLEELAIYQEELTGGEFNPVKRFYESGSRLGEIRCTEIIAERLNIVLKHKNISVVSEHHLKDSKRCDFTATKMISGRRRLLVVEVKGQWNDELYSAASAQLYDRYSIHPDAEQQGIYLVLWFGAHEQVANRKTHEIKNAIELKHDIEMKMPINLQGLVDVFVLDISE